MKDAIHVSKENYLKAILEAEAEGHQVIPATLAHWLEVSAPAVTMALKRLRRDGYVEMSEDGIVRLTACRARNGLPDGAAASPDRAHAERESSAWNGTRFTTRRSGWSTRFRRRSRRSCREKLGEGGACPHGNAVLPVESSDRNESAGEVPLSEAAAGERYRVTSLQERDSQLLLFLHRYGDRTEPEPAGAEPELRSNRFD